MTPPDLNDCQLACERGIDPAWARAAHNRYSAVNAFTHNPLLRPVVGQRHSTLDLRRCLDEGRIVLVSLNKGLLGERETQLLGMLFMGLLFNAALSRSELPPAERRAFHLYVDEAHHFTTDTVAGLLAEARKFGLHLTLANQTLAQMERHGLLAALLGNVGALLAFRLGVRDAERLASYTGGAGPGRPAQPSSGRLRAGGGAIAASVRLPHPAAAAVGDSSGTGRPARGGAGTADGLYPVRSRGRGGPAGQHWKPTISLRSLPIWRRAVVPPA